MNARDVLTLNLEDEKGLACLNCTLPICVEGHVACLYRIVAEKPALKVLPAERSEHLAKINRERHEREAAAFVPDTRFGLKYDRRRKPDTPRRQWERGYRKRLRKANVIQTPTST